jgi:hypothetical protein
MYKFRLLAAPMALTILLNELQISFKSQFQIEKARRKQRTVHLLRIEHPRSQHAAANTERWLRCSRGASTSTQANDRDF